MATEGRPTRGIRISDAAATAGVSARTLRYYEELGLLTPSLYTQGGERRYTGRPRAPQPHPGTAGGAGHEPRRDQGIPVVRSRASTSCARPTEPGRARPSKRAIAEQRATLSEALELNETLATQLNAKLARMDTFRAKLSPMRNDAVSS